MYIFKSDKILGRSFPGRDKINLQSVYTCPICGKNELTFEEFIPAVYVEPKPVDFLYCRGCKRWIAII